jgi:hypothetical protein
VIVHGDAAATAANLAGSEPLFRFGAIGGELVVLLREIMLSAILFVLLKPVSKLLSLVAAASRLLLCCIGLLRPSEAGSIDRWCCRRADQGLCRNSAIHCCRAAARRQIPSSPTIETIYWAA